MQPQTKKPVTFYLDIPSSPVPVDYIVDLYHESPESPLSFMLDLVCNLDLPIPVWDKAQGEPNRKKIGEVVYIELVADKAQGIHVIRGGVVTFSS